MPISYRHTRGKKRKERRKKREKKKKRVRKEIHSPKIICIRLVLRDLTQHFENHTHLTNPTWFGSSLWKSYLFSQSHETRHDTLKIIRTRPIPRDLVHHFEIIFIQPAPPNLAHHVENNAHLTNPTWSGSSLKKFMFIRPIPHDFRSVT